MAVIVPRSCPVVATATLLVRSSGGSHSPIRACDEGMVTPSPSPISTRHRSNVPMPDRAAKGVSTVKRLHSATPTSSTFRPP